MNCYCKYFFLFIFFQFTVFYIFGEGTKQILLNDAGHGKIQVMSSFSSFAWYTDAGVSAPEEYRLHIHIQNSGEVIYYGFGEPEENNGNPVSDVSYRIKDPMGNIIVGPVLVPLTGAGHISTFAEAVAGPSAITAGGYPELSYTPLTAGDYYIEFNFPSSGFPPPHDRTKFKYFDITVASAANTAIDGRLWSKAWQCTADQNGATYAFNGTFYIYSSDSVVTSVNCNGMAPYVFTIACNQYGCYNTSNFINDRRSVSGNHIIPQYKIFLNNPDSLVYPTGILGSVIPPISYLSSCAGSGNIFINVTKAGTVDVLLDINPAPGVQAQDVQFTTAVNSGINSIAWDGLNGLGVPVPNGTTFNMTVTYIVGLTNLPIYDIDENPNGFIINLHRPTGSPPLVYWTDQLLSGGTQNLTGCTYLLPTTGCHTVTLSVGNNNTINTWWYAVSSASAPVLITEKRSPQPLGAITGLSSICAGTNGVAYTVPTEPNSSSYQWSYSGIGGTIVGNGSNNITINFASNATSGTLSVVGKNDSCGLGSSSSTKTITILPFPAVTLNSFNPVCISAAPFALTGGLPAGGTYTIGGIPVTIFDPQAQGVGTFTITYTYTDPSTSCTKSVTQQLVVNAIPVVTLGNFPAICVNANPLTLTGGSPSGGTYSGTGVSGGVFNPATAGVGTFSIIYSYTNGLSCTNADTSSIVVNPATSINLTPFSPVCVNATPFPLTNGTPSGGIYSGTGVSSGIFNPASAGTGIFYIKYTYTNSFSCITKDSATITVNPIPGAPGTISGPSSLCQGVSSSNYSVPAIANANSYSWTVSPSTTGTITGSTTTMTITWAPAFYGTAIIFVTGVNNCGNGPISTDYQVIVRPKPAVTFAYCFDSVTSVNAKPFTLKGAIPLGGVYSGVGVNSTTGIFYPSTGTGTRNVTYNYTNSYSCSSSAQKSIIVQAAPIFTCGNKITDIRDNKQYSTVLIDAQCWMAENLNYGHIRTSDLTQRDNCVTEKYCYSDLPANCSSYGGLYQWDEILQYNETAGKQGLCLPGWHIPTETEWTILFSNYTNNGFAANALKLSGFSGFRAALDGMNFFNRSWNFINFATMFWTSNTDGPDKAFAHAMNSYDPSVALYPSSRSNAFSVRCLKD